MTDKETKVTEVEEKLEDITECSICMSTYKEPKILPCIHTFCLECLQKSGKTLGYQMSCPICRKEYIIPETGYDGLQRNFFMERLIEIKQILKPSGDQIDLFCDECMESKEAETVLDIRAEMYCTDCCQKLCNDCHRHHRKSKLSKHHNMISLDQEKTIAINDLLQNVGLRCCEEHKQKLLDCHCHDCQLVVCSVCFVENHEGHKGSDVNKVSTEFRQEIQKSVERCSSMITDIEAKRNQMESNKIAYLQNLEGMEVRVNRRKNELKELVEKDTEALLEEIKALRQQKLKECEASNDDVDILLLSLESYRSYCKQMATVGSSLDVCRESSSLINRATELEQLHALTQQRASSLGVLSLKVTDFTSDNIIGNLEEYNDNGKAHCDATDDVNLGTDGRGQEKTSMTRANEEFDSELLEHLQEANSNLNKKVTRLELEKEDLEQQVRLLQDIVYGRVKPKEHNGEEASEGKASCERGLEFHSTLKKLAAAEEEDYRVTGIAILKNEVFVSDQNGVIVVYDVQSLKFKRRFRVEGLNKVNDMKQCFTRNCLFVMKLLDHSKDVNEIMRINPNGKIENRWPLSKAGQLSLTRESNILFTGSCECSGSCEHSLQEYTSDGELVNTILIGWNTGIQHPWHAVKLTSTHYALSYGHGKDPLQGVCIIDAEGIVLKYYGDLWNEQQLSRPFYMDVDGDGNILVTDHKNKRILLLSSDLELKLQVPIPKDPDFKHFRERKLVCSICRKMYTSEESFYCNKGPKKIILDESCGRLFVAVSDVGNEWTPMSPDNVKIFSLL